MELICKTLDMTCDEQCSGKWLTCALELLQLNRIEPNVFSTCLRELLLKGRGKDRNIFLVGPANCGKTFMFKPLAVYYGDKLFNNNGHDQYT